MAALPVRQIRTAACAVIRSGWSYPLCGKPPAVLHVWPVTLCASPLVIQRISNEYSGIRHKTCCVTLVIDCVALAFCCVAYDKRVYYSNGCMTQVNAVTLAGYGAP